MAAGEGEEEQDEGEDGQREKARAVPTAPQAESRETREDPWLSFPDSQPKCAPLWEQLPDFFSFFKAVPAELPDFKKCAWLTYRIALLSLFNLN